MYATFRRGNTPTAPSSTLAFTVGAICRQLSHLTHEAGLYRMSFLLNEVAQEASLADDITERLHEAN